MRLLRAAVALAAVSAAAAGTTVTGPSDPFATAGGGSHTGGNIPSDTVTITTHHPGRFSTATQASVQTTISIWTFGPVDPDMPTLVASIISANPTATVMYVTCTPVDDLFFDSCGLGPGLTVTQMGSTAMVDVMTDSDAFSWSESCTFPVSPSAVCVQSVGGTDANFNGQLTTTLLPMESTWIAVDVTAGADLLANVTARPATTSKGASATNGSASATGGSNSAAGRSWAGLSAAGVALGAFAVGMALL